MLRFRVGCTLKEHSEAPHASPSDVLVGRGSSDWLSERLRVCRDKAPARDAARRRAGADRWRYDHSPAPAIAAAPSLIDGPRRRQSRRSTGGAGGGRQAPLMGPGRCPSPARPGPSPPPARAVSCGAAAHCGPLIIAAGAAAIPIAWRRRPVGAMIEPVAWCRARRRRPATGQRRRRQLIPPAVAADRPGRSESVSLSVNHI
jgi:hypothetical protein